MRKKGHELVSRQGRRDISNVRWIDWIWDEEKEIGKWLLEDVLASKEFSNKWAWSDSFISKPKVFQHLETLPFDIPGEYIGVGTYN